MSQENRDVQQFDDLQSVQSWLGSFDTKGIQTLAARCALRVLPSIGAANSSTLERSLTLVLRANITCMAVVSNSNRELETRLRVAAHSSASRLSNADNVRSSMTFVRVAFRVSRSAAFAASATTQTTFSPEALAAAALVELPANEATQRDGSLISDGRQLKCLQSPTWHDWPNYSLMPKELQVAEKNLLNYLDSRRDLAFWKNWYEAIRWGKPFDLGLIQSIALIDDRLWRSDSSSALAAKIDELYARQEVMDSIRALHRTDQSFVNDVTRFGIGGNHPPEDMKIEPQIVRESTIIWAAVDELKAETEKDAPDKSAVLRIIETLGRALKAILAWCAQKGDLSVDTLIKWGIPLGGAAVLANPKLVADVIEAAKVWVPFLP